MAEGILSTLEEDDFEEFSIKPSKPLSPMKLAFADAYCGEARGNSREAARIAGYANPYENGPNIIKNPVMRQYCEELILAKRVMSKSVVMWRLTEHADATMKDFTRPDGEIDLSLPSAQQNLHLLTEVDQEVRQDMEGNPVRKTKIKLQSQQRALELIGKAHGLFADRIEHSGSVSVNFNAYENIPDDELERRIAEEERNFRNARIVSEPAGSGVAEVQERPDILD
jgi:hypothetical protein